MQSQAAIVSAMRSYHAVMLTLTVSLAILGCRQDPAVWKTDLPSTDGAWVASAETDQWGGFGSAYVETTVSVRRPDKTVNSGKPYDVLGFPTGGPIRHAYVLSNDNAGGGVNLKMKWESPSHLQVTYDGTAEPDLQVVKFAGVNISLEKVPESTPATVLPQR